MNNPIRYNDPSGRICTDLNGSTFSDCENGECTHQLESSYAINDNGRWEIEDLELLRQSLNDLANSVGGKALVNSSFRRALSNSGKDSDRIGIYRRYTFSDINGDGRDDVSCHACWNNGTGTIILSEDIFLSEYQSNLADAIPSRRPAELGLNVLSPRIMVTFVHEMIHVMADAQPLAVWTFAWNSGNPLLFTQGTSSYDMYAENMAASMAVYAVGGGDNYPSYVGVMWASQYTLNK